MKDKQLRKEVDAGFEDMGIRHGGLNSRVEALEELRLAVKPCPECGHDTLHQFHPRCSPFRLGSSDTYSLGRSVAIEGDSFQQEDFHRCLTCGKDWVYGTEETARPHKPPKGV